MITRREMNAALGTGVAALLSGTVAVLRGEAAVPQQASQQPPAAPPAMRGIASLIHESLGDVGDSDGTMLILTLRPGNVSTPHRHSGPVFAYVLEGRVQNQVEPEDPKTYSAGDYWFEPAMHVHRLMKNLSDADQARVLVFMVTPKGKPAGLPPQ